MRHGGTVAGAGPSSNPACGDFTNPRPLPRLTGVAPNRAAIYTRISQADDRLAVTRQEEDCRALAARLGWPVAEVYTDNDVSATKGRSAPPTSGCWPT